MNYLNRLIIVISVLDIEGHSFIKYLQPLQPLLYELNLHPFKTHYFVAVLF